MGLRSRKESITGMDRDRDIPPLLCQGFPSSRFISFQLDERMS